MDITRAFLSSSKSSESSQTSTTSTSKRAIDDSSTSQSLSKRTTQKETGCFCKFFRYNPTCSYSSSTFVSGSQNFKIESVRSHETSTGHTRCVAAAKVSENPQLAPLHKKKPTYLTVDPSKVWCTDTLVTAKGISTTVCSIQAGVVETLVNICKRQAMVNKSH